jgi:hydrogenase expression/formation protein HypC
MCLAVPGKIEGITENYKGAIRVGKLSFGGISKNINLELVPEAKVGDYVLVHAGVAMTVIDEEEAKRNLEFLEGTGELDELYPD